MEALIRMCSSLRSDGDARSCSKGFSADLSKKLDLGQACFVDKERERKSQSADAALEEVAGNRHGLRYF